MRPYSCLARQRSIVGLASATPGAWRRCYQIDSSASAFLQFVVSVAPSYCLQTGKHSRPLHVQTTLTAPTLFAFRQHICCVVSVPQQISYPLPSGLHVDVTCTRTSRLRLRFGRRQGLGVMCCRARCSRRGKNIQTLHIRVSASEMWWQLEQWLHTMGWREQRTALLWLGRSPRENCKNDLDDQT